MRFRSWGTTHPGSVRTVNQDAYVDRPEIGLWAVADGAGGHDSGEIASAMLKSALEDIDTDVGAAEMIREVRQRVEDTHAALRAEAAHRGPQSMVASTIAVLLAAESHYACLWAGDSRIYVLRDGALHQLTRDHSLVQELVESGILRPEEAEGHPRANVITRAVGVDEIELDLEKITGEIVAGDRFLLCSDGLSKVVDAPTIAALLAADASDGSPVERLIAAALERHASDNVTAIAVEAVAEEDCLTMLG
jgi:protein phosphatase/serine/threonine-protein phosphatase Stp1